LGRRYCGGKNEHRIYIQQYHKSQRLNFEVQTSVPMFVRSAALKEGIRLRASLFALGVRRAQTGVKVRVEEAMEVLGEVSEMQSAAGDSGGTSFSSPIPCRFKCTLGGYEIQAGQYPALLFIAELCS